MVSIAPKYFPTVGAFEMTASRSGANRSASRRQFRTSVDGQMTRFVRANAAAMPASAASSPIPFRPPKSRCTHKIPTGGSISPLPFGNHGARCPMGQNPTACRILKEVIWRRPGDHRAPHRFPRRRPRCNRRRGDQIDRAPVVSAADCSRATRTRIHQARRDSARAAIFPQPHGALPGIEQPPQFRRRKPFTTLRDQFDAESNQFSPDPRTSKCGCKRSTFSDSCENRGPIATFHSRGASAVRRRKSVGCSARLSTTTHSVCWGLKNPPPRGVRELRLLADSAAGCHAPSTRFFHSTDSASSFAPR